MGTHLDRTRHEVTTNYATSKTVDAREVSDRFGQCVVDYDKLMAAKVMALPLLSDDQRKAWDKLRTASDECFLVWGGEMRLSLLTIIGRMAEYDFEAKYSAADMNALLAASAAVAPRTPMEDLALCLVRANPVGTRQLIATTISSVEEKSAFKALGPDLGPCVPAGQDFTFNVSGTRDIAAAGLYLVATRPQLSEPGK